MPGLISPLQQQSFRIFTALLRLRPGWGGHLVLVPALDSGGLALCFASLACGAAVLVVDADAERQRAALRAGCADFGVTTLDESLRILKNEIRQRHPVCVALHAEPASVFAAMLQRGVQPDSILSSSPELPKEAAALLQRPDHLLYWPEEAAGEESQGPGTNLLTLLENDADGETSANLRAAANERWRSVAPRLFPRDGAIAAW